MPSKELIKEIIKIINFNMNNWAKEDSDNFIDIKNDEIIDFNCKKQYLIISKDLDGYQYLWVKFIIIKSNIYKKILN